MKVKGFIAALAVLVLVLAVTSPALAVSLGVSPSHSELEVPADGSATANFKVHYYSGDLKISLVDIPLRVEPETIHIESSSEPTIVELTIYGDESLGSRIYDGYVRFLGVSGEMVAAAVEVKAKITNLVAGETPVPATPEESQPLLEVTSPVPEQTPPEGSTAVTEPIPPLPPAPLPPSPTQPTTELPILLLAGIGAGTLIIITLIVVLARRPRY